MKTKFSQVEREEIVRLAYLTLKTEDSPDVEGARSYLKDTRGLTDEVIDDFRFGYIPNRLGHDWRGRVIMPLYDQYGQLVVMTSRKFRVKTKGEMPHLHEQFNKRRYLFGIDVAKKYIIEKNAVVVVEGQFDTTTHHVHGIKNCVGVLGSALTFDHIALLRRYCQNIYLMFDNDKSGRANIERAVEIYDKEYLREFDTEIYPVFFDEEFKDPDDFILKRGVNELRDCYKTAKKNQDSNLSKVRLWQHH